MNYVWIGVALSFSAAALAATDISTLTDAERHALAAKTEVWTPVPPVVTAVKGQAPSDAIQLLDQNLSQWTSVNTGAEAQWTMKDGVLTVKPGTGDIRSKESFCDIQLHLEWRVGKDRMDKEGQLRNNSGIFLQEMYEIQILDSYQNKTYPNGQAGAVLASPPTKPAGPVDTGAMVQAWIRAGVSDLQYSGQAAVSFMRRSLSQSQNGHGRAG